MSKSQIESEPFIPECFCIPEKERAQIGYHPDIHIELKIPIGINETAHLEINSLGHIIDKIKEDNNSQDPRKEMVRGAIKNIHQKLLRMWDQTRGRQPYPTRIDPDTNKLEIDWEKVVQEFAPGISHADFIRRSTILTLNGQMQTTNLPLDLEYLREARNTDPLCLDQRPNKFPNIVAAGLSAGIYIPEELMKKGFGQRKEHIKIFDPDIIEQTQDRFPSIPTGAYKVIAVLLELLKRRHNFPIKAFPRKINSNDIRQLANSDTVFIETIDDHEQKFSLRKQWIEEGGKASFVLGPIDVGDGITAVHQGLFGEYTDAVKDALELGFPPLLFMVGADIFTRRKLQELQGLQKGKFIHIPQDSTTARQLAHQVAEIISNPNFGDPDIAKPIHIEASKRGPLEAQLTALGLRLQFFRPYTKYVFPRLKRLKREITNIEHLRWIGYAGIGMIKVDKTHPPALAYAEDLEQHPDLKEKVHRLIARTYWDRYANTQGSWPAFYQGFRNPFKQGLVILTDQEVLAFLGIEKIIQSNWPDLEFINEQQRQKYIQKLDLDPNKTAFYLGRLSKKPHVKGLNLGSMYTTVLEWLQSKDTPNTVVAMLQSSKAKKILGALLQEYPDLKITLVPIKEEDLIKPEKNAPPNTPQWHMQWNYRYFHPDGDSLVLLKLTQENS